MMHPLYRYRSPLVQLEPDQLPLTHSIRKVCPFTDHLLDGRGEPHFKVWRVGATVPTGDSHGIESTGLDGYGLYRSGFADEHHLLSLALKQPLSREANFHLRSIDKGPHEECGRRCMAGLDLAVHFIHVECKVALAIVRLMRCPGLNNVVCNSSQRLLSVN